MTFDEVVTAILQYADRAIDSEVATAMPTFLRVVEARINHKLKVQKMTSRTRLETRDQAEYYGLPLDFDGMRDIAIFNNDETNSGRITPRYASPEIFDAYNGVTETVYYTILANQLRIFPQPEGKIIQLVYYRNVPPLGIGATTANWVSNYAPNVYIFGAMVEVSSFVKDAVAKDLWDERFKEALDDLDTNDGQTRWSGPPLEIRNG